MAHRGCGVSLLGDIKSGQGPRDHLKVALLEQGVGRGDLHRSLPTSAMLWSLSLNPEPFHARDGLLRLQQDRKSHYLHRIAGKILEADQFCWKSFQLHRVFFFRISMKR